MHEETGGSSKERAKYNLEGKTGLLEIVASQKRMLKNPDEQRRKAKKALWLGHQ